MSEGAHQSYGVTPKKTWPMKNTWDLIKKKSSKYWKVVQLFKSLGETSMTSFHTWHYRWRESIGTWVVGMRSLISCMTRNIPYRIALFIWNVIGCFHGSHCMCI